MGLFKKRERTNEELEAMRAELRGLRERLERSDTEKLSLDDRVGRLHADNERLAGRVEQIPVVRPDTIAGLDSRVADLMGTIDRQRSQIADLALVATDTSERAVNTEQRIDGELSQNVGRLAEKLASLESRIDQVSTELTNQLGELSGDLDRASAAADASEQIDAIVARLDDMTGGQTRLANEQARYAIQFREDLADLADRLRKQR